MYKLTVKDKVYSVADNELLADALIRIGLGVHRPCGGRGKCGKCTVIVNGENVRSCLYRVDRDINVNFPDSDHIENNENQTLNIDNSDILIIDIGTTTLVLGVYNTDNHEFSYIIRKSNPQAQFGSDVIARIKYCAENGISDLQRVLVQAISSMMVSLNLSSNHIKLYASGNTTMLHLLLGKDCSSLGIFPYTPSFLSSQKLPGSEIKLDNINEIETLPCISAFVGADITAGIIFAGLPRPGRHHILIDLGTNAEIALISEDSCVVTSAAAGPCFEGAEISCGMSATDGAICSFSKNGFITIGNVPPCGICGTGLIDAVAYLLQEGIIDNTGYLSSGSYQLTEGVILTQDDIRCFQLAKSAVYSALMTLITINNVSLKDVDRLYISGGFSESFNVSNAVITGLIPSESADKCVFIDNTSLLGTAKFITDKERVSPLIKKTKYEDLSLNTLFSDLFIKNISFQLNEYEKE